MSLIGTVASEGHLVGAIRYNENEYRDGFADGKREGQASISKFGIQNEVKGTNLVTCDYVNENEHNVEVKLSSDTVTDFSGIEVVVCGKNIFDTAEITPSMPYKIYTELLITKDITISAKHSNDLTITQPVWRVRATYKNGQILYVYDVGLGYEAEQFPRTFQATESNPIIELTFRGDLITQGKYYDVQCEFGFATDFQPHIEKTYIANADGTVEGVTSISPIMNIICDGVDISAKYYCMQDVEWHRFWDVYQRARTDNSYDYAFGSCGWNSEVFKPKHDIIPSSANSMFRNFQGNIDLTELLEELGIVFDTSKTSNFTYMFANSKIKRIPLLDMSKATFEWQTNYMFTTSLVETIDGLRTNGTFPKLDSFTGCSYLKNIIFDGVIAYSINFQWSSVLTVESAKNIIQCLANHIDTNPFVYSISFHADVWEKLEAEGETSPNGNTWEDYLFDIGWTKL